MRHRPPQPESPLVRFLRNPAAPLEHALTTLRSALLTVLHALPFVAGGAIVLAAALILLARSRARRRSNGARLLEIGLPPTGEGQGALLLWGHFTICCGHGSLGSSLGNTR